MLACLFIANFHQYARGQQPFQGGAVIMMMQIICREITYSALFEGDVNFCVLCDQQTDKSTQIWFMTHQCQTIHRVLFIDFTDQKFRVPPMGSGCH